MITTLDLTKKNVLKNNSHKCKIDINYQEVVV